MITESLKFPSEAAKIVTRTQPARTEHRLSPMPVATRDKFIASVTKSNVIPPEKLKAWLASVDDEDPKTLASKFVRDSLLTLWQAKFLLSGRSRLNVGNYVLLSRISSDELGDKFEAIHTQLNRQVVIQFFPTSIAQDASLLNNLLAKLRQITELDHPNLIHVYDVDQESDRFFLVTEYVHGMTLDAVPQDRLSEFEIARIISGIADGLTHAHHAKIVHGNLTPANIFVTNSGKAKLQGFPSATLIGATDKNAVEFSADDDFKKLTKIGVQLLKSIPQPARSDQFRDVAKLCLGLAEASKRQKSLIGLSDWVAANTMPDLDQSGDPSESAASGESNGLGDLEILKTIGNDSPSESTVDIADFQDLADLDQIAKSSSRSRSSLKLKSTQKPNQAGPKNSAVGAKPASKKSRNSSPASPPKKPTTFIALVIVAVVLAVGAVTGLGYWLISSGGNRDIAKTDSTATVLVNGTSATDTDDTTDTDASADSKAKQDDSSAKPTDSKTDRSKTGKPAGNQKPATSQKDGRNSKADSKSSSPPDSSGDRPNKTDVENTAKPNAKKSDANNKPSRPSPRVAKADPSPATSQPSAASQTSTLSAFPTLVDLPGVTTTKDYKLGDVVIESNFLLGMELLAEPIIARGKINLQLERTADDRQTWDVKLDPKRGDPLAVAQFQKTEDQMIFRWLPAAVENEEANYLRNAKIKLFTPKENHWVGLRRPVTVRGFKMKRNETSAEVDVDIDWLPNSQAMKIQLEPFRTGLEDDDVGFAPREITTKDPGRIFFRKKTQERFFFVEVDVNTGRNLSLTAQMNVLLPDGSAQRIRSLDDLDAFAEAINVEKKKADFRNAEIKKTKKPKNMESKDWTKYKAEVAKTAREISKALEVARAYPKVAKNLGGKEIPILVYFDMDGQRIILAKSK